MLLQGDTSAAVAHSSGCIIPVCSAQPLYDMYHTGYTSTDLANLLTGQVLEWQICSEPKRDSHRFMDAIESAITEVQLTHTARRL